MDEIESLSIDCPICTLQRTYTLRILRLTIRYYNGAYGPWYDREFIRLFVCPTSNDKFES
jgi:hypothetical protein